LVVGLLSKFQKPVLRWWLLLYYPYREERKRAGIKRDQTLQNLLFTQKGTDTAIEFIQQTGVATRGWQLQGSNTQ
jgi:hypothetical protein